MATNIHTLTYPLAPVACDICAHDERTLAALQRHYSSRHDLSVQWRCACCNFVATWLSKGGGAPLEMRSKPGGEANHRTPKVVDRVLRGAELFV
ncbi:hypothetical protein MTO96_051219 [Rhipicephalus appendiculatus]